MKILFLTRLYSPHVGGVEKHIEEIVKILSARHQISIITEQYDDDLPLFEQTNKVRVHRIPVAGIKESEKKWVIWKWIHENRHLLGVDVIHIHDVFFWLLPYKFSGKSPKMYMTFHGYEGYAAPSVSKKIWHKIGEVFTDGNMCIGDFHKKWYGTKPKFVSYGGVSAKKGKSGKRNAKSVFIGRLAQDTGIMDYLVASYRSKVPLDVYGGGPQSIEAERFIKSHHAPVKLCGFVPQADKHLASYSFAFVSRYLGILECLISKTPVIAHYNNEIKKDYLAMAPFADFIEIVDSPEAIVAAMHKLRDNTSYARNKIEAGYKWASQQTWQKLASQYEDLWSNRT